LPKFKPSARDSFFGGKVNVLLAIIKKKLQLDALLYTLLQILSATLFEKMTLQQALPAIEPSIPEVVPCNKLNILTI
jgi:hypothetical protein